MKSNLRTYTRAKTHEGASAGSISNEKQLERLVASCLLFENTFYESGSEIAKNISDLCAKVSPQKIASLAVKARTEYGLRHVPLFLVAKLDENKNRIPEPLRGIVSNTVFEVVKRADELSELLAIIAKTRGVKPSEIKGVLSAQVKKGLARAFSKFEEYHFQKYADDKAEIKLRDVLFLVHAKPGYGRKLLYKRIVDNNLAIADTWETRLSSGADKFKSWTALLNEGKLGPLALIRNVRNMHDAGVGGLRVADALRKIKPGSGILPFQFISAARNNPYGQRVQEAIEYAMFASLEGKAILPGSTVILVDVSGSMDDPLSSKSTASRLDAASSIAVLLRETCEKVNVATFSSGTVALRLQDRGMALVENIRTSQPHASTNLFGAVNDVNQFFGRSDRLIVITDEQAGSSGINRIPAPNAKTGYVVNVASYKPSLDISSGWTRINGFSERLVDYIRIEEGLDSISKDEE